MRKYLTSLDVSICITVSFGALGLPENTQNMNMIILKRMCGARRQFFFDKPYSLSDMLETYALPQLNNKNLILHNGRRVCLYCSNSPRMFEHEFPRSMDRKWRSNYVAPRSPDLTPLDFYFCDYMKDDVYRQRVKTPHELKAGITAEIANVTKDMLQQVWQYSDCGWDVCRATYDSRCEVFQI
jgi:hypothetical protein